MVTTKLRFTAFYDFIDKAINATWAHDKTETFLQSLATHLEQLCQELVSYGDEHLALNENLTASQILDKQEVLIFYYHWVDAAKSFLVLWRNTIFENQKAYLLEKEGRLSSEGLQQLQKDALAHIQNARGELETCFDKAALMAEQENKPFIKQLERWYKQDVPWPTYRIQINRIGEQAIELSEQRQLLQQTLGNIHDIKTLINDDLNKCTQEINTAMDMAVESLSFIRENVEKHTTKISLFLEQLETKIPISSHSEYFMRQLEQKLDRLTGENNIATVIRDGVLLQKKIHFKRDISRWLDSEILPVLLEIWELNKNVNNGLKMALINIRNRALLITNDQQEDQNIVLNSQGLSQPINNFLQQTTPIETELKVHVKTIINRMEAEFKIASIFKESASFLSIPLQSTINQLRSNQNKLWKKAKECWDRQLKKVNNLLLKVQQEDALSTSEKIVRYIENRTPKSTNQAYNSIFLTKGYIGESFWVGRTQELKRVKNIIQQWELGYRGTVLLAGNRFSGKSLFGDLVSNRYFAENTIRLVPNSTITVDGRTFTTTLDLGKALAFISKNSVHSKKMIWLDDLELWHDSEYTISQNIVQLQTHIDKNFGRIFYLVALSNYLNKKLSLSHHLDRNFQAQLNMDSMSTEEITEAIQIRHGATHKALVNKDGEIIQAHAFKNLTTRTYRNAYANIGEALNLWACNIAPFKGEQVINIALPNYSFPDFLEADTALVLKTLLLEKTSNEYRLRKRFGPAFNPQYANALLRLQSLGLVKRRLNGWLEINELVANDIGRLLESQDYL